MDLTSNYHSAPARTHYGFGESIGRAFSQYFTFSGRASRAEYWWFILFTMLLSFAAAILDVGFNAPGAADGSGPISAIVALVTLFPSLAVASRRMHDTNHSAWWVFAPFLLMLLGVFFAVMGAASSMESGGGLGVLAGIAMLTAGIMVLIQLVFLLTRGNEGDNRFGPDPYR